ncbi:MAG: sulfatase-like hydrolase/transferase, partial [[Mycobacterium] stephanolepidis]
MEPTNGDTAEPTENNKRGGLSRRSILGGIAAAGVGAAAATAAIKGFEGTDHATGAGTPGTGPTNEDFHGKIALDVRDSTPDWTPYELKRAPEGAPNILVVLYDDTGLAAWSPFGGRINMPVMQRLADNGLRYSQWHTTALCSPTRSCLLTGRNHHVNRSASITEASNG